MRPRASLRISWVSIRRTAARHIRKTPVTFTSITRFHSSRLVSVSFLPRADDGVVDHDVEPAGRQRGPAHRFLDVLLVRDVALEEGHVEDLVRGLAALDDRLGDVHQQKRRAFRVELLGDGAADARGGAGDEGGLAGESVHAARLTQGSCL